MLTGIISSLLNFNVYLPQLAHQNPILVYGILFALIFIETGLVILPFLPGDSILFLVGSLSTLSFNGLNFLLLVLLLVSAAILGDFVNFEIGEHFGPVLSSSRLGAKLISRDKMEKSQIFFDKHGASAIILARFTPIVRTFIPFIAGMSRMQYVKFARYNAVGGASWIVLMLLAGALFGAIPLVKQNFELITVGIVFISILPMLVSTLVNKVKQG
ncbi:VTT domain-containing protein [Leuconostoc lactis]|uniref:VTT domain-containing protein n=1 Tax=Leuconostoc lactis TaxID=1246 RepID=UPI000E8979DB|nr:VTT domain-containing protein [Leuconostoc lactis]HBP98607.1 hypothetical protein [Leuconostoc lactis]